MNEAMQIKFSIIMKFKKVIYDNNKTFFNKIETYTSKKMQYFWKNNTRKYQILLSYFKKKDII